MKTNIIRYSFIFCLILVLGINNGYSQYYNLGQNPASTKWKQINTIHFQVIFPEGFEKEALRTTHLLNKVYEYGGYTLGHQPKKIAVILQNNTLQANAFVTWAPKRVEIYSVAPQDNDVIDWITLLAVHEFRHVVQIDKFNQGIGKVVYALLGEQGIGGVMGAMLPLWFLEGDATLTETLLTPAGRGRMPSFEKNYRALLLQHHRFSYQKAYHGSYKDVVPSFYDMGYFMTTKARRDHDAMVWDRVLNRVVKFPFTPYRFSHSLYKETGKGVVKHYKSTFLELDSLWKEQETQYELSDYDTLVQRPKTSPVSYRFPVLLADSSLIYVSNGYDRIPAFYRKKLNEAPHKIHTPGSYDFQSLSANQQYLIWSERIPDLRWQYRDFSDVFMFDLVNKKRIRFTHKQRLFAPAISKYNKIVAVAIDRDNTCYLQFMNINGEEYLRFTADSNELFKNPTWSVDGKQVYYIAYNAQRGNELKAYNTETGESSLLYSAGNTIIANPSVNENYIYFSGSQSGIDNIYALSLQNQQIYKITESRFGAYYPTASDTILYYSDYTYTGFNLAKSNVDTLLWKSIEEVTNQSIRYYEPLLQQELNNHVAEEVEITALDIKSYPKHLHGINIHSWNPVVPLLDEQRIVPGFKLLSQDKLGHLTSSVAFYQDQINKLRNYNASISWDYWYPRIGIGIDKKVYIDQNISLRGVETISDIHLWNTGASVSLPFNFSRSKYRSNLLFSSSLNYSAYTVFVNDRVEARSSATMPMQHSASYSRALRTAVRDIRSKWAQSVSFNYGYTPFTTVRNGTSLSMRASMNVPSVFKHHVITLRGAIQQRVNDGYFFANSVSFPRGIQTQFSDQIISYTTEYAFPLFYPDLSITNHFYLKRFRTVLFYDFAEVRVNEKYYDIGSYGTELVADCNAFRWPFDFQLGVRYSQWVMMPERRFEFLFNFSL